MKKFLLFILTAQVIFGAQDLYAGQSAMSKYNTAIRHIKLKQPDFAFMEFRSILRESPKSYFAQKAKFAIAEYYYDNKIYNEAIESFTEYIKDYPGSKACVFAKAYLVKIIEDIKNPAPEERELFENIQKDFFSKPLFLLFKEYKEASYKSPLRNKFKIRYYIDNIEVYRNGRLFIKITQ